MTAASRREISRIAETLSPAEYAAAWCELNCWRIPEVLRGLVGESRDEHRAAWDIFDRRRIEVGEKVINTHWAKMHGWTMCQWTGCDQIGTNKKRGLCARHAAKQLAEIRAGRK